MGTAAYGVVALISMLITDNGGWYERWYPWVMLATTSIGLLGGFVLGASMHFEDRDKADNPES